MARHSTITGLVVSTLALAMTGCGQVTRQMTVRSYPSGALIYLNGQEIYRFSAPREYEPDEDMVANVELKAGLNVLVFKVVNETKDWQGAVRFTDAAGRPVRGIKVGLDPH